MTGMLTALSSSHRTPSARRVPANQPDVLNDYDMAASITQGTTTVGWTYSPDRLRLKMCAGGCTSPTSTTLYLRGPAYSEKVTAGATITWHDSITADGQLVATRTKSGSTVTMQYLVNDHLGSPAVVTDATGAVVERDSFDAWGKRRNADFTADPTCSLTSTTTRGFTEQEHVDALCLENFNARMYDPLLAHFASADTIVPDPYNGQSFNHYAYANGNPLNVIDPSGHEAAQPPPIIPTQCTGGGDYCRPLGDLGSYGPPCWGSGLTTNSSGNIISMETAARENGGNDPTYNLSVDGQTIGTCGTDSCLKATLDQIVAANNALGLKTEIIEHYPGLDGDTIIDPPSDTTDPLIFINGWNAQSTVGVYIDNLLNHRADLRGHVKQFSWEDSAAEITAYASSLHGPITLIANSLGADNAAIVAIDCNCITTLITLAPVGALAIDFQKLANSVDVWIDMRTPIGAADLAAMSLSAGRIGPWGNSVQGYATQFIDSPPGIGHAEFWPQMDYVCGPNMIRC